jgi:hypothetical protein
MRVAMDAPCSVMLVKQSLPFKRLASNIEGAATMDHVVSHL